MEGERATDRQCLLRSPEAVAYCDWSFLLVVGHRTIGRMINNDRTTSGSHKRSIVQPIVAPDDRSYDQSWNSAAETSPHFIMSGSNRLVVPPIVRWHDQF